MENDSNFLSFVGDLEEDLYPFNFEEYVLFALSINCDDNILGYIYNKNNDK